MNICRTAFGVAVLAAALLAGMTIAADGNLQVPAAQKASTASPAGAAAAGEWPRYRGAGMDGISTEKFTVPAGGPKKLWNKEVGAGFSAMAVSGGMVFTMGNQSGKDVVWCLKADTGDEVWKHSYDCSAGGGGYPGPRCTPAVDGSNVYTISNRGDLFCLDVKTGKPVWNKKASEFGAKSPQWSFSGSPLVAGDSLIVDLGVVVSLNKATGAQNWKTDLGGAGYSSPMPFTQGKQQLLAVFPSCGLVILDMATGKELKRFDWTTKYEVNAAMPIVADPAKGDKIFISSGYGAGCALVDISGNASAVWQNKNMANHTSSSVLFGGHLYGFSGQVGGGGALTCMDIASGSVKWSQKGMGHGGLVIADGKMVIQTEGGSLVIAEASPAGYKELAKVADAVKTVKKQCWNSPVLAGGRIYCRSETGDLACFDVSGK
ncbi:MAG: PQQ-binding-like beta-propeller repeat protein [Planctomycetes bacterium]|nr:PQQ-binding-like beta-propeller repeat protein [Planctomycetota bacterium]